MKSSFSLTPSRYILSEKISRIIFLSGPLKSLVLLYYMYEESNTYLNFATFVCTILSDLAKS